MAIHELEGTILRLAAPGKGILAADESQATLGKRFAALHIESSSENRRIYRELLLTTPEIEDFFNGVILHEETLGQRNKEGLLFPELLEEQGILPGIKVDKGLIPLNAKEKITQGLDGLAERLIIYKNLGACFAKWRAVFTISDTLPSSLAQLSNAQAIESSDLKSRTTASVHYGATTKVLRRFRRKNVMIRIARTPPIIAVIWRSVIECSTNCAWL